MVDSIVVEGKEYKFQKRSVIDFDFVPRQNWKTNDAGVSIYYESGEEIVIHRTIRDFVFFNDKNKFYIRVENDHEI